MTRPGYILVETIFALLIFGLVGAATAASVSHALRGARAAQETQAALSIARTHLARMSSDLLNSGDVQDVEEQRFAVAATIRPVQLQAAQENRGETGSLALYDISVRVAWQSGGQRREIALASRRTGRAETGTRASRAPSGVAGSRP